MLCMLLSQFANEALPARPERLAPAAAAHQPKILLLAGGCKFWPKSDAHVGQRNAGARCFACWPINFQHSIT